MSLNVPTQAMILAAGAGKRMGTLTNNLPKPMIAVGGRTLIDRALDNLEENGITKIVVNTSYKAEIIEEHLKKRSSLQIIFSREATALETGGGIANALHHFNGEPFFSVNGDVIWIDKRKQALQYLTESWNTALDAVLLLHKREDSIGYEGKGDFFVDKHGHITRRKPEETAPYIYTGIQLLHPRLFNGCPQGAFSLNVLYNQAISTTPPKIKGVIYDGELLNVGDPTGKELAENYYRQRA